MAHSRVFCMVRNLNEEEVERALAVDNVDVVEAIRGCDYADDRLEEGNALVQEDVDWLASWIGIKGEEPLIKPEVIKIDGVEYYYWAVPVDKLKEAIEEEKKKRVKRIKKELEEEKPDLGTIAYEAYLQKGFFFYLPDLGFLNEIDLYEFVLENTEGRGENFYIVKTIDYHF